MKPAYKPGILITGVLIALTVNSCEFPFDCTSGNGNYSSEERIVSEFSGVENTTSFDVKVYVDTFYSVEVFADENLLSLIKTSIRQRNNVRTLIVETNNCVSRGNVSLEIHVPLVEMIKLTGSADIDVYNLKGDELTVENSGSGDININDLFLTSQISIKVDGSGDVSLYGKARYADYEVNGSGDILANDMKVDECYVRNDGSGNIYCFAYDLLDVEINGSGDVIYSGTPEVVQDINGSGSLIRRN
jgi:hypothetical protein